MLYASYFCSSMHFIIIIIVPFERDERQKGLSANQGRTTKENSGSIE